MLAKSKRSSIAIGANIHRPGRRLSEAAVVKATEATNIIVVNNRTPESFRTSGLVGTRVVIIPNEVKVKPMRVAVERRISLGWIRLDSSDSGWHSGLIHFCHRI